MNVVRRAETGSDHYVPVIDDHQVEDKLGKGSQEKAQVVAVSVLGS